MNNEEKILGLLEKMDTRLANLESDVSGLKSWQAKADEFMDFARGSMLRMENEKLPIAKIALETADGHTDKLANHDRRIHKVENLTEDHGNRIWALEQVAGK